MNDTHLQNVDIAFQLLDGYLEQTAPTSTDSAKPARKNKLGESIRLVLELVRDILITRRDHMQASILYDVLTMELKKVPILQTAVLPELSVALAVHRLLLSYRTE